MYSYSSGRAFQQPFFHHYFFWFHMPLFFMISGYLFHSRSRIQEVRGWILKKWMRLLIPYFSFGLLIAALIFVQTFNVREVLLNIYHLCIGGRTLGYYYGVFWFVTCLFLTHLVFAYASLLIKRKRSMVLFLALCYFIAHIYVSFPFLQQKTLYGAPILFCYPFVITQLDITADKLFRLLREIAP